VTAVSLLVALAILLCVLQPAILAALALTRGREFRAVGRARLGAERLLSLRVYVPAIKQPHSEHATASARRRRLH
jgi:hypothetical protein